MDHRSRYWLFTIYEIMAEKDIHVPIEHKLALTVNEAAEYSNIGQNKIATLLKLPDCPFVLFVGSKKLVKRKEFEEFISKRTDL